MALINCSECTRQVSDTAPSCPQCGALIALAAEARAAGALLTTTQGTSKKLKMHGLLSLVLLIVGLVMVFSASDGGTGSLIGGIMALAGLIWNISTRVRIWWHHK